MYHVSVIYQYDGIGIGYSYSLLVSFLEKSLKRFSNYIHFGIIICSSITSSDLVCYYTTPLKVFDEIFKE